MEGKFYVFLLSYENRIESVFSPCFSDLIGGSSVKRFPNK
jgi:hypothetical protein